MMEEDIHIAQTHVNISPHDLVFERKFDIALRASHGIAFRNRIVAGTPNDDDKFLLSSVHKAHPSFNKEDIKVNVNIFPKILYDLLSQKPKMPREHTLKKICRRIKKHLEVEINWNQNSKSPNQRHQHAMTVASMLDKLNSSRQVFSLWTALEEMDQIVSHLSAPDSSKDLREGNQDAYEKFADKCRGRITNPKLEFFWSRFSVIIHYRDDWYLFQRSYALLIHNKFADLLSVLALACFYPDKVYGCEVFDSTIEFVTLVAKLAIKYDQKFFHISKVLESIVIGETLIKVEGMANRDFLESVVVGVYEKTGFDYESSTLKQLLLEVPLPLMQELGCLSKLFGHPFCDIKAGAEDLEQKVNEPIPVYPKAILECIRHCKQDYIRRTVLRHGKWPPVKVDPTLKSFVKAQRENRDPTSASYKKEYGYDMKWWDRVEILPNYRYEKLENFIPYVKDKTVSAMRSPVLRKYVDKEDGARIDWKETRALLLYLMWPEEKTSHLELVDAYCSGEWDIMLEYLVIRVVPKEKEHKINARGFGCTTPQNRARLIVQEHNTATVLDDVVPEQTLTDSEHSLIQKLYSFRHLTKAYTGFSMIIVNVDANAWNNRFRDAVVKPVAKQTLDKMFNTGGFSNTHTAYQKSFVYVPDIEEVYFWFGQEGGIEGLNQYTWDYLYVHQIKACMSELPYRFHLLCKGDDLRVAVLIPPETLELQDIDDIKKKILEVLSTEAKKFGHKVKIEDSYASEAYFAFSKNAYVSGVEQPQSFRKIQKCYGANNAFMSTIDDYVASSYSNAHSASRTSPSPIACYAVALFWAYRSLEANRIFTSLTDDEATGLMLVPNLLGGFPIIFLHNFFVRAESDLLPSCISLLQFTNRYYPGIARVIERFFYHQCCDPMDTFESILIDPYCLPIHRPNPAATTLRKTIERVIRLKTRNRLIKELFSVEKDEFTTAVVERLKQANVINAKVFSVLYACTPAGIVRELIRKFETGRSIYDALILHAGRYKARKSLMIARKADITSQKYKFKKATGRCQDECILPRDWENKCPAEVAQIMRDTLWDKPVQSITQPPVQHMISLAKVCDISNNEHAQLNHFEMAAVRPNNDESPLFNLGIFKPFMGQATGSGLEKPTTHLIEKNMLTSKLYKLLDLWTWSHITEQQDDGTFISSNLPDLIAEMVHLYTHKDLKTFLPFASQRAQEKTIQHHVRSNKYRVSVTPNTLINLYTHCKGDSYTHETTTRTSEHYYINYFHIYCHTVSLLGIPEWLGDGSLENGRYWAITPNCNHCMRPIKESALVVPQGRLPPIELTSMSELGEEAVQRIVNELDTIVFDDLNNAENATEVITIDDARQGVLQHYFNYYFVDLQDVNDYYVQHPIGAEGYDVLQGLQGGGGRRVALEDINRISAEDITRDLILLTFYEVSKTISLHDLRNVSILLAAMPPKACSWTNVLYCLSQSEIYFQIQSCLARLVNTQGAGTYENPETYSRLFGTHCVMAALNTDIPLTIIWTTYSASAGVPRNVTHRLNALQWHFVIKHEIQSYYTTAKGNEAMRTEHLARLCVLAMSIDADEIFRQIPRDAEGRFLPVNVPLFDAPDSDQIVEQAILWDDPDERPSILNHYRDKFKSTLWDTAIVHLQDLNYADKVRRDLIAYYGHHTVRLVRTTITTCIDRLRNEPVRFRTHAEVIREASRLNTIKRLKDCPLGIKINAFAENQTGQYVLIEIPEYLEVADEPNHDAGIFKRCHYLRPYGCNNISMSKMASILEMLDMLYLPPKLTVCNLADGYGGYCATINAATTQSFFVFNSAPDTHTRHTVPAVAEDLAADRNNLINYQASSRGVWDLKHATTFLTLEKDTRGLSMLTIDLELGPHCNETEYEAILINTAQLFLANSVRNGILIMKTYIMRCRLINHLMALLVPQCKNTWLLATHVSGSSGEIYVVAQSHGRFRNANFNHPPKLYPPAVVTTKIARYHREYCERFVPDALLNIHLCRYRKPQFFHRFKGHLPYYSATKMMETTGITLPPTNDHLPPLDQLDAMINSILIQKEALQNESEGRIRNPYLGDTLSTHTHKLLILARLIQIQAFLYILVRYKVFMINRDDNYNSHINSIQQELQQIDHKYISLLPVDYDFVGMPILNQAGKAYDLKERWCMGIRFGLSWITANIYH